MATNADQWKWRQRRISADQWKWRQRRICADQRKWRQRRISADQRKWRQRRISAVSIVPVRKLIFPPDLPRDSFLPSPWVAGGQGGFHAVCPSPFSSHSAASGYDQPSRPTRPARSTDPSLSDTSCTPQQSSKLPWQQRSRSQSIVVYGEYFSV